MRSLPRSVRSTSLLAAVLLVAGGCLPLGAQEAKTDDKPAVTTSVADYGALLGKIKSAQDRAARWLHTHQNPDGGYGPYGDTFRIANASDVGITSYVLYALSRHPRRYTEEDGPFISAAVDLLLQNQQKNGAFYDPRDPTLLNYKTSVALLALRHLDRSRYADAIGRGHSFIRAGQFAEGSGYDRSRHVSYGGHGYGSGLRPDNSNTQFSLESLAETGLAPNDELWSRAEVYLRRSLNSKTVDPLVVRAGIGTTGDGGARYSPNSTRGPVETLDDGTRVFSSYGSMSYAVLKSFLYAQVDRNDPDVQGLAKWLANNFTVRENPGMATPENPGAGRHGLFYYYQTMAKALRLWGEARLVDDSGTSHHWAPALAEHLMSIQKPDGSWQNVSDRWWENLPSLDTAYAMVALASCADQLKDEMKRAATGGVGGKPAQ